MKLATPLLALALVACAPRHAALHASAPLPAPAVFVPAPPRALSVEERSTPLLFVGAEGPAASAASELVRADLERSGFFLVTEETAPHAASLVVRAFELRGSIVVSLALVDGRDIALSLLAPVPAHANPDAIKVTMDDLVERLARSGSVDALVKKRASDPLPRPSVASASAR
jgi:hypothetical protein